MSHAPQTTATDADYDGPALCAASKRRAASDIERMRAAFGPAKMPTSSQIDRAARAWRDTKERETDGFDRLYFLNNWAALPGLREFVDREMAK